jgi:hypothetical protein
MATQTQVLKCHKCGTTGTFEYERAGSTFFENHLVFISLSSGFTYREDAKARTHRVTCKCGEVVLHLK